MAFDSMPGGDPKGPSCPKCGRPIGSDEPSTIMHFHEDPHGDRGLSGKHWHSECARLYWDRLSGVLQALNRGASGG